MRRPMSGSTTRRLMLMVASVALLLGAADWGRRLLSGGLLGMDTDRPALREIETIGRVSVPAGASNLHARIRGFQDRTTWLRFDLPVEHEPAFRSGLPASMTLASTDALPGMMASGGPDRDWWTPGSANPFEVGQAEWPGVLQSILIERPENGPITVYVLTSEF